MLAAKAVRPGWLPPLHTGKVETVEPFCWHWRDLRPDVLKALELVGTQQAERRILNCTNPGLDRGVTRTMVANFQIVGPGEIARAHRHTPAALRMIVESTGGYTVVNGDVVPMLEGDLVLTPNWTWHDHANDSQTPIIWLDGLDAPLVAFLNARFQEEYPEETQKAREDVDSSRQVRWRLPAPDLGDAGAGLLAADALPLDADQSDSRQAGRNRVGQQRRRRHGRVQQPAHGRARHADDRLLRATPGAALGDDGAPPYAQHDLPRDRGRRRDDHRWRAVRMGLEGRDLRAGLGHAPARQLLAPATLRTCSATQTRRC